MDFLVLCSRPLHASDGACPPLQGARIPCSAVPGVVMPVMQEDRYGKNGGWFARFSRNDVPANFRCDVQIELIRLQ